MNERTLTQQKTTTFMLTPVRSSVLQRKCACGNHTVAGGECAECRKKRLQRKATNHTEPEAVPPIVHEVLRSPGQPLDPATRAFMEPRFNHDFSQIRVQGITPQARSGALTVAPPNDQFEQEAENQARQIMLSAESSLHNGRPSCWGYDFSQVHIHTDAKAARSAREVNALAYTVGRDIVFGEGQYAPQTTPGRQLLAHELTHVVQQSHTGQSLTMQRQTTFSGGPGRTAPDRDRPMVAYPGPMPYTPNPGGTPVPNTASRAQNCAGDSCSIRQWINWPFLGYEVPNVTLPANVQGNWRQANSFVPSGCTRVNCSGINVNNTRCRDTELELIAFLYRWPVVLNIQGTPMAGTQSDFHMIGRNAGGLPSGWHSKMDRRERVVDIRDPLQSLHDSYPHTRQSDRTIQQLCFCCNQSAIRTT